MKYELRTSDGEIYISTAWPNIKKLLDDITYGCATNAFLRIEDRRCKSRTVYIRAQMIVAVREMEEWE